MLRVKFVILILILGIAVSKANDSTYSVLLKQGKEFLQDSKYKTAISLFDSCIKINSKDPAAYNLRAIATIFSGPVNDEKNNKIAIQFFTNAIKIDSLDSRFYNNRGWSYQWMDSYALSMKDFKKALSLDTTNPIYYGNVLRVLWIQNKNKEAYAYYVRGQLKRDYLHKYPEGNKDVKKSEELGWEQGRWFIY